MDVEGYQVGIKDARARKAAYLQELAIAKADLATCEPNLRGDCSAIVAMLNYQIAMQDAIIVAYHQLIQEKT